MDDPSGIFAAAFIIGGIALCFLALLVALSVLHNLVSRARHRHTGNPMEATSRMGPTRLSDSDPPRAYDRRPRASRKHRTPGS